MHVGDVVFRRFLKFKGTNKLDLTFNGHPTLNICVYDDLVYFITGTSTPVEKEMKNDTLIEIPGNTIPALKKNTFFITNKIYKAKMEFERSYGRLPAEYMNPILEEIYFKGNLKDKIFENEFDIDDYYRFKVSYLYSSLYNRKFDTLDNWKIEKNPVDLYRYYSGFIKLISVDFENLKSDTPLYVLSLNIYKEDGNGTYLPIIITDNPKDILSERYFRILKSYRKAIDREKGLNLYDKEIIEKLKYSKYGTVTPFVVCDILKVSNIAVKELMNYLENEDVNRYYILKDLSEDFDEDLIDINNKNIQDGLKISKLLEIKKEGDLIW